MTLFGKKKFGRGSPYILSFLSGFLKGKNGLFEHLWAEQIKQQQHIFHSKIITMFLLTLSSSHLKSPPKYPPSFSNSQWECRREIQCLSANRALLIALFLRIFSVPEKKTKLGHFDNSKQYSQLCIKSVILLTSLSLARGWCTLAGTPCRGMGGRS